MGLFRRKPPVQAKVECVHKWKDFDWFIEYNWRERYGYAIIYEPYVCILCKERKNVKLERFDWNNITLSDFNKKMESLKEQFPKIKPRPVVEDEVQDAMFSIDREYLALIELYYPKKVGK